MKSYEAGENHDWADLRALGDWIVAEQVGVITKTRGGVHVPDNARMAVWTVFSAGPDVKSVKVGDRILFLGSQPHNIDGRIFSVLQEEVIMAVLSMPIESAEPDATVPEVVPMPETSQANGKPRIIRPS